MYNVMFECFIFSDQSSLSWPNEMKHYTVYLSVIIIHLCFSKFFCAKLLIFLILNLTFCCASDTVLNSMEGQQDICPGQAFENVNWPQAPKHPEPQATPPYLQCIMMMGCKQMRCGARFYTVNTNESMKLLKLLQLKDALRDFFCTLCTVNFYCI